MRKKAKKILSLVLVFSMLMSLFSIAAYAEEAVIPPANQVKQVVTSHKDVVVNGQNVSISKSLEGTNTENIFDITLQATTETVIQNLYKDPDIAVAIVMDISGSMCNLPSDNPGKQYLDAVSAAQNFISTFCAGAKNADGSPKTAVRDLTLVTFNTNAKVQKGLTDCTTANLSNFDSAFSNINTEVEYYGNGVFNSAEGCYKDASNKRFTNIEAGLRLGQNVLNQSKAENKFMILLTDGFPTTYYAGHNSTSTTAITGYDPYVSTGSIGNDGYFYDALTGKPCTYGTSYSDKGAKYAKEAADAIKDDNITLFTVGINIGGQNISTMVRAGSYSVVDCFATENAAGAYTATDPKDDVVDGEVKGRVWLTSDASSYIVGNSQGAYETWLKNNISSKPEYYSDGSNLTALNAAYEKFQQTITTTIENAALAKWITSDPMGDGVEFLKFYDKEGNLVDSLDSQNSVKDGENNANYTSKINWDLKKSGYTSVNENNKTIYTYTLKYRVRLKNEANGFTEGESVNTNGTTQLEYQWKETVNGVDQFVDKPNLTFPVPAVKGYLGSFSFMKVDEDTNAPCTGAEFSLTHKSDCPVCGGSVTISTAEQTSGSDGVVSFSRIPSGHEYTLTEKSAAAGYENNQKTYDVVVSYGETSVADGTTLVYYSENETNNMIVTNPRQKIDITVSKVWNDGNNQDGIRPDSVTVQLWADGEPYGQPVSLNENNNWKYTFEELYTHNTDSTKIVYTVTEEITDELRAYCIDAQGGFMEPSVSGTAETGFTVTNSRIPEVVSVSGSKTWNDNDNAFGNRPERITIRLLADGVEVPNQVKVVTAEDNWTWIFENLDKNQNGKPITYTFSEDSVPGYIASYTGSDITNSTEYISVSGSKKWEDGNNQDGLRPTSITINLLADGTEVAEQTVTSEMNWSWNFSNLLAYKNGQEINYEITEEPVEGYRTAVEGYNVTNTHIPETISISGSKTWNDNNIYQVRPDSITIRLYADGKEVVNQAKTVTAADGWNWTFENLPKYAAGEEIVYSITEDPVEDYTTTVDGYNVTNTLTPVSISGSKIWDDADNQDGKRPESIIIRLYADGNEVAEQTVSAQSEWKWNFTGLDKYAAGGSEIEYTVSEDVVEGYETVVDGNVVTNTHVPEQVEFTVNKVWAESARGMEADSVTIRLYADGKEVRNAVLSDENDWAATFTELPKYSNGQQIKYTVAEDSLGSFWTAKIEETDNGWTVTNSYYVPPTPNYVSVNVSKVWNDANNQDGLRPASIVVQLLRNGRPYDTKVLSEGNWSTSWAGLSEYETWTVAELNVPEGYTSRISGNGNSYTITNTHVPYTSLSVKKVWDDENDKDGIRPDGVQVELLENGKGTGNVATLSDANGWAHTWTQLGGESQWSVSEINVPEGYTSSVSAGADSVVVTNTHIPEEPPTPPVNPPTPPEDPMVEPEPEEDPLYGLEEDDTPLGDKEEEDPLYGLEDGDIPFGDLDMGDPNAPKTSDNSMLALWLMMTILSGLGVVGLTVAEKKRG